MTSTASLSSQAAPPAFGKFFLPGPTDVHPEVLEAMIRPMIGHRSSGMEKLLQGMAPKLGALARTTRPVSVGPGRKNFPNAGGAACDDRDAVDVMPHPPARALRSTHPLRPHSFSPVARLPRPIPSAGVRPRRGRSASSHPRPQRAAPADDAGVVLR